MVHTTRVKVLPENKASSHPREMRHYVNPFPTEPARTDPDIPEEPNPLCDPNKTCRPLLRVGTAGTTARWVPGRHGTDSCPGRRDVSERNSSHQDRLDPSTAEAAPSSEQQNLSSAWCLARMQRDNKLKDPTLPQFHIAQSAVSLEAKV